MATAGDARGEELEGDEVGLLGGQAGAELLLEGGEQAVGLEAVERTVLADEVFEGGVGPDVRLGGHQYDAQRALRSSGQATGTDSRGVIGCSSGSHSVACSISGSSLCQTFGGG